MGFMLALAVILQDLDDPAIADPAMPAFAYHTPQLGLQGCQLDDPPINFLEMTLRYAVRLVTRSVRLLRHGEELSNVFDREPELSCVPYESKTLQILGFILAAVALGPRRSCQKADLLIKTNRRDLDATLSGCLTN